jgi:MraZ protein
MVALPRFTGSVTTTLDDKNRLTIPARFKEQLLKDAGGGNRVVISRWVDPCLVIHPLVEWERRCEELARMRDTNPERRQFRYVILGTAQDLELDKQNRILLPQALRQAAGIERDVTLVGDIERILLWDSARWARMSDLGDDRLSEMYERFYTEPPPPTGGQ